MSVKNYQLPLLTIVAGVLFTLYLHSQIPDGVYFSGDAGLKALLAQQLSTQMRFDLIPPNEAWIDTLWNDGLYPYEEPFVYIVANRYYITFPFTFPLVTAPFYALFGYRGMYIVPLVALWATWFVFYWICRRLQLNGLYTAIALFGLIFASPLTLYSAMYWEHTLSVGLCLAGLALLLTTQSRWRAIASGCLIGLAVWFRPEFLCIAALLTSGIYLIPLLNKWLDNPSLAAFNVNNKAAWVASLFLTIGLFFLCNKLIYGYALGIHSIQVVEQTSLAQKLRGAWNNFQGLSFAYFEFFPIALFPILYIFSSFFHRKIKFRSTLAVVYVFWLLFTIGVSVIVPVGTAGLIAGGKQWGPRFLLMLVPIVTILAVIVANMLAQLRIAKYISAGIISLLFLIGFSTNTIAGVKYLQKNYQGVYPALQFLQKESNRVVAISHQFVAQNLEPSVGSEKVFFKVDNEQDLAKLSTHLVEQGIPQFTYICYPFRPCPLPQEEPASLAQNQFTRFDFLGEFGKYPIYKVAIAPE